MQLHRAQCLLQDGAGDENAGSPEKPVSESNGEIDGQPAQRLGTLLKFQNDFDFDSMKVPPSG
jgi:hypothetical protein